jgi:hypothetical protein
LEEECTSKKGATATQSTTETKFSSFLKKASSVSSLLLRSRFLPNIKFIHQDDLNDFTATSFEQQIAEFMGSGVKFVVDTDTADT